MSKYSPTLMLCLLPFAYDPWALDVLTSKYIFWVGSVGLWASIRLWSGTFPKGAALGSLVLALCFLPSIFQGASWAHTWLPSTQAFALLWWGVLLWDALVSEENDLPSKQEKQTQRSRLFAFWLQGAAWGLCLIALVALLERWSPHWLPWQSAVPGLSNATMGNPNHLGALLSVGLPVLFVLGGRALWCLPLLLAGLAVTGSRLSLSTAYLLLLLGGGGVLLRGPKKHIQERIRIATWAFSGLLGLWLMSGIWTPQKQLAQVSEGRGGLKARLHLLQCALPMTQEALPWGIGYGRFRQKFPSYRGRCLKNSAYARSPLHTIAVHLHNDWVQLFLEGGLVMALFLLWLLLWWARQFFSTWKEMQHLESNKISQDALWLLLVILGFFVQMGGTFPLQLPSVLALASVCFLILQHRRPTLLWPSHKTKIASLPKTSTTPRQPSIWMDRILRLFFWGVWLCVLFFSVRIMRAEHLLVQGMQAMEKQDPRAEALLKQSEKLHPSEHTAFQLGQVLLGHEKTQEAIKQLQRAFDILPDVQVALTLAEAYVILRDVPRARAWLQRGLALQPHHKETHKLRRRLPRPSLPTTLPSSQTTSLPQRSPKEK